MRRAMGDEKNAYIKTGDGSITLRDPVTGEWYHNSAGAFRESMDNYVIPAVYLLNKSEVIESIKLLDVCFGLGYNSFSFINHLLASQVAIKSVEIYAVELDKKLVQAIGETIEQEKFQNLNDCQFVDSNTDLEIKDLIADQSMAKSNSIQSVLLPKKQSSIKQLNFNLYFKDLRTFVPALVNDYSNSFDLVFHDPFSANKQPQFWTKDLFLIYRKLLKEETGMLFTYSVASAVRGGLIESGFSIYRTKAVGVKSGGTLGLANSSYDRQRSYGDYVPLNVDGLPNKSRPITEELFFSLDKEERQKVMSSSGIPYRDSGFNLDRKTILRNRQNEQDIFKRAQSSLAEKEV